MTAKKKRAAGFSRSELKGKLGGLDHAGLVDLVADLYALDRVNQTFLRTRFAPGTDALHPYKARIHDAIFPGWNRPVRVAEARKAIAEYRKAAGRPKDMLELHVFYCETAAEFAMDLGISDEGYFDALLGQFEAALARLREVDAGVRAAALARLAAVRDRIDVGYGVKDTMIEMLGRAGAKP